MASPQELADVDVRQRALRALEFCDRALTELKAEDPSVPEAIVLVEGTRTELLRLASE